MIGSEKYKKGGEDMAGKDNLVVPTSEQAREFGRRGGIASAAAKQKRKNLRELALALLDAPTIDENMRLQLESMGLEDTNGAAMMLAMLNRAVRGSEDAARFVRDTSGQAPKVVQQVITGEGMTPDDIRSLADEELQAILAGEDDDASENEDDE